MSEDIQDCIRLTCETCAAMRRGYKIDAYHFKREPVQFHLASEFNCALNPEWVKVKRYHSCELHRLMSKSQIIMDGKERDDIAEQLGRLNVKPTHKPRGSVIRFINNSLKSFSPFHVSSSSSSKGSS